MAWSNPSTRSVGYGVRAADWNEFVNNFLHLGGMTVGGTTLGNLAAGSELGAVKVCHVARSGDQSRSGAGDPVDWNVSVYDAHNWHSTSVNPHRVTVDTDGVYVLTCRFATTNSFVETRYYKNGVLIESINGGASVDTNMTVITASAGDYFHITTDGNDTTRTDSYFNVMLVEVT